MIDIEKWQKLGEFVSKNWLATLVGIVIGGGLITALYENFRLPSVFRPDARYETWQIKGVVDLQSGNVPYSDVTTSIRPPDLQLMPDGSFTAKILVEVKPNGRREYPKLIFSGIADHAGPVVHILEPGTVPPPGAEDYKAQHILEKREIHLNKKVVFSPLDKEPWRPTVRPEKTGAEGGQSKEVEK